MSDQAIKDRYAGLKALIMRRFGDKSPELESALAKYEQKPEVWKELVKDLLQAVGADRDQELLDRGNRTGTAGRGRPTGHQWRRYWRDKWPQ